MELTIGSDLARLVRLWRVLIDQRLKPLGITQTQWITLHNINKIPSEQSQIQLAKAIGIEQPSLVRTLDQLEEKGMIVRQVCSNDRRTKKISLTEYALSIINDINDVIVDVRHDILGDFSKDDLNTLTGLVLKLEKNINGLYKK